MTDIDGFLKIVVQLQAIVRFNSNLSTTFSRILTHSKTIQNTKKLSVSDKYDSCRLSNFLQAHIFWNFDYISRTYNWIYYRTLWFAKLITILIRPIQVLIFDIFSEKETCLNANELFMICNRNYRAIFFTSDIFGIFVWKFLPEKPFTALEPVTWFAFWIGWLVCILLLVFAEEMFKYMDYGIVPLCNCFLWFIVCYFLFCTIQIIAFMRNT